MGGRGEVVEREGSSAAPAPGTPERTDSVLVPMWSVGRKELLSQSALPLMTPGVQSSRPSSGEASCTVTMVRATLNVCASESTSQIRLTMEWISTGRAAVGETLPRLLAPETGSIARADV